MTECKYCGCTEFYEEIKGPHLGEYCRACNGWQRWKKQIGNEGKTKDDYRNEFLDKQPATDQQRAYIRNLLKQNQLSKLQASKIIEALGGEVV